jgi:type IV secretory pathway component VirB8
MDNRVIVRTVNDGRYFVLALKWYNSMFLMPARGAAILQLLCTALLLLLCVSLYNLYSVFPLSKNIDVVMFLNDTISFYPRIKNIAEENKSTKQVVSEYLCAKYVAARETYLAKKFESKYQFIMNCSSKEVFDKYYSFLSTTNSDSPLTLYKNNTKADIEIISHHTTKVNNDNLVTVVFNKKIYAQTGNMISQKRRIATLKFYLSEYDFSKSTNAKLDFIVTEYNVKDSDGA